ncbi:MAG: hypothetical protein KJO98_16520 [Rhodothermia bacterium]|nr:hypothetical protein [Rhodothermia bacterium]
MDRRKFSREEAEQIFAGAARRQQEARHHDETFLTLDELEAAAKDAGIDEEHVRAAAADILRPSHAPHVRSFLGVPVEVRESKLITVPPAAVDWGAVVTGLRSVFGKQGVATDLGSVREWTSDAAEGNMPTRVVIEPEGGGTRVTVERKMWPSVVGVLSGAATTLSVGLIIAGLWLAGSGGNPMWVPALVVTAFSVIFGAVGHRLINREGKRTIARFRDAMAAIEASADDTLEVRGAGSVEEHTPGGQIPLPNADEYAAREENNRTRTDHGSRRRGTGER